MCGPLNDGQIDISNPNISKIYFPEHTKVIGCFSLHMVGHYSKRFNNSFFSFIFFLFISTFFLIR
jgi:hypothetical protein